MVLGPVSASLEKSQIPGELHSPPGLIPLFWALIDN